MKSLKRTLALVLALLMIFSVVPLSPAALGFEDSEEWIAASVDEDIQPPRNDDLSDDCALNADDCEDDHPGASRHPSEEGNDDMGLMAGAVEVSDTGEFEDALINGIGEIALKADIAYNKGIVLDGYDLKIDLGGYTLTVDSANGAGLTVIDAKISFEGTGRADIAGTSCGVYMDNGFMLTGALSPVVNISAKAANGVGVQLINGRLEIGGTVSANGANGTGVIAMQGAQVYVGSGISAGARGVSANGKGTKVYIGTNVSAGSKNGIGIYAGSGAYVNADCGVSAENAGGVGAHADGGEIYIDGAIKAAGTGAIASAGGEVLVDGGITGKNGTGFPQTYVKAGNKACSITGNSPTTIPGTRTYTDGESSVWVSMLIAEYVYVGNKAELAAALDKINAPHDNPIFIRLTGNVGDDMTDFSIDGGGAVSDSYIDLNGFQLILRNLSVTNASLTVLNSSGTANSIEVSYPSSIAVKLDNGTLKTGDKASINIQSAMWGIHATNQSTMDINGSVSVSGVMSFNTDRMGIIASERSKVRLDGDVTGNMNGVYAQTGAEVEVTGNVTALNEGSLENNEYYNGIFASEAKVIVKGNVAAEKGSGVRAVYGAKIIVDGSISVKYDADDDANSYGINAEGNGTSVTVKGAVGNSADYPNIGIYVSGGAYVFAEGTVTGGDEGAWAAGVGSYIYISSDLKAEEDSATAAYAADRGEIYVAGDISTNPAKTSAFGVKVFDGSKVTVDGEIKVKTTAPAHGYIQASSAVREKGIFDEPTTKPGYFTYSDTLYNTGSTVWVKIPSGEYECRIGSEYCKTFREGFEALGDGDTLTLLNNVIYNYNTDVSSEQLTLAGIAVTIDIAGFNLIINNSGGTALRINAGAKLTFDSTGSGKTVEIKTTAANTYDLSVNGILELSERFISGDNELNISGGGLLVNGYSGTAIATVSNVSAVSGTSLKLDYGGIVHVLGNVNHTSPGGVGLEVYSSKAIVDGNVTGRIYTQNERSEVTVKGNVTSASDGSAGIEVAGSNNRVTVLGDVTAGRHGIYIRNYSNSTVTVKGGVIVDLSGSATGSAYGIYINGYIADNTVYVGSVTMSGGGSLTNAYGVYNGRNANAVYVTGDVDVSDVTATNVYGVYVDNGAEVTVGVEIEMPILPGVKYICIGEKILQNSGFIPTTTKRGFRTYTDEESTVWVKMPDAPPAILTPGGKLPNGRVGQYYYEVIYAAVQGADHWEVVGELPLGLGSGLQDYGEFIIANVPTVPGIYTFMLQVQDAKGFSDPVEFTIEIEHGMAADPLTISPTHAVITNTTDVLTFTASLNVPDPDIGSLRWYDEILGGPMNSGNSKYTRTLSPSDLYPHTFTVTAVYDDGEGNYFEAAATVEVIPDGINENTTAKVLETKVTVNRAKNIGALVPVLITDQTPNDLGLVMFSEPDTGSKIAARVELFTQDSKSKEWNVPLKGYTANMYAADQGYIEINADATAKNASKVKVFICSANSAVRLDAGIISLSVVEKWPKLTVKAGSPNIFYREQPASLSVTADDGSKCEVFSVTPVKAVDAGKVYFAKGGLVADNIKMNHKGGTIQVEVNVLIDGYKPIRTNPKVNVKVVRTAPKLKLSQNSLMLIPRTLPDGTTYNENAEIRLVSGDKNPFENGYKINEVSATNTLDDSGKINAKDANLSVRDYDAVTGRISLRPRDAGDPLQTVSGTQMLYVGITGAYYGIYMPLKVTMITESDLAKLSVKSTVKSAVINVKRGNTGVLDKNIAEIPLEVSAKNFVVNDWEIKSIGKNKEPYAGTTYEDAFILAVTTGTNRVTLRTVNGYSASLEQLVVNDKDTPVIINIGSTALNAAAGRDITFAFTLTLSPKDQSFTLSLNNKIDISNPFSAVTATVKFINGTEEIASVMLYEDGSYSTESGLFKATVTGAKTFSISAKYYREIPAGVKQNLWAEITLKSNGDTLRTLGNKLITITPTQTKSKAVQSAKAVTMYKSQPKASSASIKLNLTTPANVTLGAVSISEASLKACKFSSGGFVLEQTGPNHYAVRFKNGTAPAVYDKNGKLQKLKTSYTLKLELWAEGTYTLSGGRPVAIKDANGKAKTSPTVVTVKVNLK